MDMLKSMLDKLYSSQNGMMYFYIISASIAFILIILIIVTIAKGNKNEEIKEEVKEENKENTQKIDEPKSEELPKEEVILAPISEIKEEEVNSEIEIVTDTNKIDSAIEELDDGIDLPKVKEEIEDNKDEMPKLTNDVLAERLNALKNKD
ncbi:MAG: hypothetical protein ACI4RP_06675 [Acutalibacteraceae bacterium]